MPQVGETIKFAIGRHVTTGVVFMTDSLRNRLLVEIAPEVYEVVYSDEVVY